MMLAAADLGIGSGHSAVADQEQAQRVLGFPGGYLAVYLIGLGYPADRYGRSPGPAAGLSTRLCTGTAGSALDARDDVAGIRSLVDLRRRLDQQLASSSYVQCDRHDDRDNADVIAEDGVLNPGTGLPSAAGWPH
jgi:hypothetical protein